jgi:hypothetical protein
MVDLLLPNQERALTSAEFRQLADVPAELEWLVNIRPEKPRRAYQNDLRDFSRFVGLEQLTSFAASPGRISSLGVKPSRNANSPKLSMANNFEPVSAIKIEPLFPVNMNCLASLSAGNFPIRA